MMASIDLSLFFQRYTPKFVHVLISTLLELTLIILHFLNCILLYLTTKYASLCGLETPCLICSASVFKISLHSLVCNDHVEKIPQSTKRVLKKSNRKDSSGFSYVIYGPPWRVVQHAKNGNVIIDRMIRKETTSKDCCAAGDREEEDRKPDFVEDELTETMNKRCIIHHEERLASLESADKVNSIWFHEEKLNHQKTEFTIKDSFDSLQDMNTAGDGKTKSKSKNDARKLGHMGGSIHSQNAHSYSSLSDIMALEASSLPNLLASSESPSPKEADALAEQETKKRSLSCKSLEIESSLAMRNRESIRSKSGVLLHNRDPNSNSCKSMFEITPFETAPPDVNLDTTFERPVPNKNDDELDASVVKGNEEETKGEELVELDASLEKLEEERCSITERLNQLQQRLLIVEKDEQLHAPEDHVIEEERNDLQQDYKSLAEIFHREINYSTNDLVSLGKEYNQRRNGNSKMKRMLPSLQESNFERGEKSSSSEESKLDTDAGTMEDETLGIQKEMDKLHERLEHINSEREWIKQSVRSLKEGGMRHL